MILLLVLPALFAVLGAVGATFAHRRLRPDVAVPVLSGIAAASAVAVVAGVSTLALGSVAQWSPIDHITGLCARVAPGHVDPVTGVLALLLLTLIAARFVRRARSLRVAAELREGPRHEVLDVPMAMAFTVPGRPGRIVVTRGLIDELEPEECEVVWAHETAHVHGRHGRYIRLAELAAAVPLLGHIAAQVRFSAERAADETAAEQVGDRRLVARAVARAALVSSGSWVPPCAIAMSALHVESRIHAMLDAPPRSSRLAGVRVMAVVAVLLLVIATSGVQLHHMAAFIGHVCGRAW